MDYQIDENNNLLVISTDPTSGQKSANCMSLQTVAETQELLGLDTPADTVEAIMKMNDPGVIDKATGANAWTSAYQQIEKEQAANDPSQPVQVTAMSADEDGRAKTRQLLGLEPDPSKPQVTSMAATTPVVDKDALTKLFDGKKDDMDTYHTQFIEALKPVNNNPGLKEQL